MAIWLPPDEQQGFDFGDDDIRFDGETYEPEFDRERLGKQARRVYNLMADHEWRTLREVQLLTGDPQASISARLRDFRKRRFGSHTVNRRSRGDRATGLWEYQLAAKEEKKEAVWTLTGPPMSPSGTGSGSRGRLSASMAS